MAKIQNKQKQFLLKDQLFNKDKITKLSKELASAYPKFKAGEFTRDVMSKLPKLELKDRIMHIRDCLKEHLPEKYRDAVNIILKALPPELDPNKTDNDFGDFIYAPYGYFISTFGLNDRDVNFSLKALESITKRFTAEGPIRAFLNHHPDQTWPQVARWAKSSNYHIRRLASEGTRPFLPWAEKIDHTMGGKRALPSLDVLHSDHTRYVTRSVANHLNDLSKINPKLVLVALKRWRKQGKQDQTELSFMTKHALRTLVKQGNPEALKLLGYTKPFVRVSQLKLTPKQLKINELLQLTFHIKSTTKQTQRLMIDYIIHFRKARGDQSPKVYKLKSIILKAGEAILIEKTHPLKLMSTRALYPGIQTLELQINGQSFGSIDFSIIE